MRHGHTRACRTCWSDKKCRCRCWNLQIALSVSCSRGNAHAGNGLYDGAIMCALYKAEAQPSFSRSLPCLGLTMVIMMQLRRAGMPIDSHQCTCRRTDRWPSAQHAITGAIVGVFINTTFKYTTTSIIFQAQWPLTAFGRTFGLLAMILKFIFIGISKIPWASCPHYGST